MFFRPTVFLLSFSIIPFIAAQSTASTSNNGSPTSTSNENPPTSAPTKNPKRGLAFAAGDTPGDLNNANQTRSVITWIYDWDRSPAPYLVESHIEYVPMQWGAQNIETFGDVVKSQGAKSILAFNEPDVANQANLEPTEAANLWKEHLEPLKEAGVRLGAPAVTAPGTGIPWLTSFFAACSDCSVDFIPLHWYGEGFEGFYQYLWAVHSQFPSVPIWVTEFGSTSTDEKVVADFLNETVTYLDSLDWIERYAWFGFFRPSDEHHYNLLDEEGGLNELGQLYIGANTVHTQKVAGASTKSYTTIQGGNPTQGIVTTFAAVNASARTWTFSSGETLRLGVALSAVVLGAVWTIL